MSRVRRGEISDVRGSQMTETSVVFGGGREELAGVHRRLRGGSEKEKD